MKLLFIAILYFSLICQAFGGTIIVTNTNNTGSGSLRNAVNLANHGDTIRFSQNLLVGGNASIYLDSSVNIDKHLVIKGLYSSNDTLYLDGKDTTNIFTIEMDTIHKITIDSVCFINGKNDLSGGAINISRFDTLIVRNSSFFNCKGRFGGCISSERLIVKNCLFKNNYSLLSGGCIYSSTNYGAFMVVENSIFKKNKSGLHGGAITCSFTSTDAWLEIKKTIFEANEASFGGGAISGNLFKIDSTRFVANYSTDGGGAIHSSSASFPTRCFIKNSQLMNNISDEGGAISLRSYGYFKLDIRNSSVINNRSNGSGGAIYGNASYNNNPEFEFYLHYSTISNNISVDSGSAITLLTHPNTIDSSFIEITNSTVCENKSFNGYSASYVRSNFLSYKIGSSIIANTSSNFNDTTDIHSLGYNIISDSMFPEINSDRLMIDSSDLDLGPLQYNGGFSKTRKPRANSIAIDNGNPNDSSDAQNREIIGVRDIGAAEYNCEFVNSTATCSVPYYWYGNLIDSNGSYRYVKLNNNGCDSVDQLVIDKIDVSIADSLSFLISNETSGTYQWLICNQQYAPIVGETNRTYTPNQIGFYAVEITKQNCIDTSTCLLIQQLASVELIKNSKNEINIYPNPTDGKFTVDFDQIYDSAILKIIDLSGNIIYTRNILNESYVNIDLDLNKGAYFLQLESKFKKLYFKFVIQ